VKFVVARNPDPDSRLPYLVRLPIEGGLILKVRDTWPRTSRVFCARIEGGWPSDAEILEDVPVSVCRRRGVAIDLVLERPRESRSQFVFTTLPSGREGIFWQTRKVVTTARPGARIPGRRASGLADLVIVVDSRERYPYRFSKQQATTVRAALAAGDYAVSADDGTPIAVVERKSLADLAGSLNNGTLVFELAKLTEANRAAVVVEDRYGSLLTHAHTPAGFLPDMLARVQVRYPEVPIVFLETRPLAEEWTFRYLGAALAEHESMRQASSGSRAAEEPSEYAASAVRSRRPRRAGV
jgi:ERCC4 domain